MQKKIETLEKKRDALLQKLAGIGDIRRGSIYAHFRRCGKKQCACSKPGHPGHGPQYLWTATIEKRQHTRNLHLGPELQKYLHETDNYKAFKQIITEIIEVNEQLCDLRPVPVVKDEKELADLKKKLRERFRKRSTGYRSRRKR